MESNYSIFILCATYLLIVKVIGPNLMQHREPFNLKWIMVFYNILQILINASLAIIVRNRTKFLNKSNNKFTII